jgi:3',5'-cyclic AMP phosphodiesterase CpdA
MKIIKISTAFLLTIFTLTLTGCGGSAKAFKTNSEIESGKDITFYIASDLHYLSNNLTDHGSAFQKYISSGDGKQLEYIDSIVNAFTQEVESKKPDVLILSGDLTNNGEKESHIDIAEKLKGIEKNGTKVFVIPGNHDISNPWARGFKVDKQYTAETIDDKDFRQIYGDFGYDEAISKDKNSLSYLAAPSHDVWLLMLDTNIYKNNIEFGFPETDGELSQGTLDWIKQCIALAKTKGAVILPVMHHNIVNHSAVIRYGFTLNNNTDLLDIFKKNNIDLVLSGHIHIQEISTSKDDAGTLYDIATNSLAVYPHQHGILKYSARNNSFDYSTSIVDVEGWAKETGVIDKNLNNFKTYSEDYFGKSSYNMAANTLKKQGGYSEKEIKLMSGTMRTLNLRYFAGTESLNSKDIANSEGFNLWSDYPDTESDSFLKTYFLSISRDRDVEDNNNLHVQIRKIP